MDCGVRLTNRQMQILKLLASDDSLEDIANQLSITYATITSHLSQLYPKLGVSSRNGAVVVALKLGLMNLSEITFEGDKVAREALIKTQHYRH